MSNILWTDLETDFLLACAKQNIPYEWIDKALGKPVRSCHSRSRTIDLKPSVWKGRVPYKATQRLRPKMVEVIENFRSKGLMLKWLIK